MQQSGCDFLAHACGPRQKNTAACRGHPLECCADCVDRTGRSRQLIFKADLGAQGFIFAAQALCFGRTTDQVQQPLRFKRFFDEICCSATNTLSPLAVPALPGGGVNSGTMPPMFNSALADQLKAQGIAVDNSSVFQVQDGRTVVLVGNQQQQAAERRRNIIYGGAAGVAVLGLAFFAFNSRGDETPTADPVAARGEGEDSEARFDDLLTSAETLVDDGKFSQAQRMLDAYEEDFKRYPPLMVRATELSVRLETSRMLASGRGFEQSGDKVSALKIYRSVLDTDAGNSEATTRIKALVGDTNFALVNFTVDGVVATVSIDGTEIGVTPITHPLTVGKHQLVVKAEGYRVYTTTYPVTGGKDETLKIPLEPKSAAAVAPPPTKRDPTPTKKPPPTVSDPQPPKPKPKPKPDDDDMLMPIKRK